ncbi:MAG: hypothetical protein OXC46_08250 [Thaumarchaeota archaeon]|nr:hypothetical protein [Nitrososphaerota archaeon]
MNTPTLTYTIKQTPDGYIATWDQNKKVSVFAKTKERLGEGINAAARMYVKFDPTHKYAKLLKTTTLQLKKCD